MIAIDVATAGSVLGLATGATALIAFVRKVKTDTAMERAKDALLSEERGRRKEKEERMEMQIDSAHEKIRKLNTQHDELRESFIEMKTGIKYLVDTVTKLDQKFDRHEEREKQ